MHATTEQLLMYRDGLPQDHTQKQHIQNCDECLHQVQELLELQHDLQTLEDTALGKDQLDQGWQAIRGELANNDARKKHHPVWAMAACIFVVAAGVLSFLNLDKDASQELLQANTTNIPIQNAEPNSLQAVESNNAPELEELIAYSRLLENRLHAMPQPRVVRANTVNTITELQDQISILDDRLSLEHQYPLTAEQRNALWQQRVQSMNNLYRVRNAQLQRVSYSQSY
ncbi:MAG: hypothetical protein HKN88_01325 [Gammaproteobacteria bacterium]|nr:hypothetical protein [Gammaproteobacteria bacterium]NNC96689.1 hypothetical protein [Gammaproteobacteria bacterium]NNM13807.1 hypothetical protein [Gammaproteobacteria bacterium]